jgi:subtilisin family serine protease
MIRRTLFACVAATWLLTGGCGADSSLFSGFKKSDTAFPGPDASADSVSDGDGSGNDDVGGDASSSDGSDDSDGEVGVLASGDDDIEDTDPSSLEESVEVQGPKKGDRVLIKFRPGAAPSTRAALHRRNGFELDRIIPQLHVHAVKIPPGKTAEDVMARYERHPLVDFVEQEVIFEKATTPNDPLYPSAIYPHWHLQTIGALEAWDTTSGRSDIIIAIIDTGVNGSHEDLASKMVNGWNVVSDNSDTHDFTGHGTTVAGAAAAATDNSLGVASVSWDCKIMPIVAAEGLTTSSTELASALTWAADHGASIANMSFGAGQSAIQSAAAQYFQENAGNQGKGGIVTNSAGNSPFFQDIPDDPYILTVTATGQNDLITSWSTTGNFTDLAAPGELVATTTVFGDYGTAGGTSISAPIVAAVGALALSVNPDLTGVQLQQLLKDSADDKGPEAWDPTYGWGRVNAKRAVQLALGTSPNVDTTPPTASLTDPLTGATLSGMANITVQANDDTGVQHVDLYCDSSFVSSDTTAPHVWSFDTTKLPDGLHTFRAEAFDSSGNSGQTATVQVTIDNGLCSASSDCDDSDACTTDSCISGTCSNTALNCDDSDASTIDSCDATSGCVHSPLACDDDNACTTDTSDAVAGCLHIGVDCDDNNACTSDSCNATTGCRNTAMNCDDGDPTTNDNCDPGTGCVHSPVNCDDGNACTLDTMNASGVCSNTSIDCDDNNACTSDSCDSLNGCMHAAVNCNDGDPCTADRCDPSGGCANDSITCNADETCVSGSCEPIVCNFNGTCDPSENCDNCPIDCSSGTGASCGNGMCEAGNGEDCVTCPTDCNGRQDGKPANRYCCGAGGGEGPIGCGDARCNASGSVCITSAVVPSCCGDGVCDGIENGCDCAIDCGTSDVAEVAGGTCRDGLDNDCDGLADCTDPDCAADALCMACNFNGVCEPGEDCHACSNDCRGRTAGKSGNSFCCGNGVLEDSEADGSICNGNP